MRRFFPLLLLSCLVSVHSSLYDYLSCYLCEYSPSITGKVGDCSCEFDSVNRAASDFFLPILHNLTATTYFKYFAVDMHSPCPFWCNSKLESIIYSHLTYVLL